MPRLIQTHMTSHRAMRAAALLLVTALAPTPAPAQEAPAAETPAATPPVRPPTEPPDVRSLPRRKIQLQTPPLKGTYTCPIWDNAPRKCALMFSFGRQERPKKTFLMTGVNVAYGRTGKQNALLLGGEASVVRWLRESDSLVWGGLAFDGLYDFGLGRARTAAGLELGMVFFGAELQYVHEWGHDGRGPGVRAGLLFSLFGLFDPYVRYSRYFTASGPSSKNQLEAGLLLKIPLVWWTTYKGVRPAPLPSGIPAQP